MSSRFESIFHKLKYEIDIQLTDSNFNLVGRNHQKIYHIQFGTKHVEKSEKANYMPMHNSCGLIRIHRDNPNYPNVSYLQDIILLLHEFGHHRNILVFKPNGKSQSKTGFLYEVDISDQLYYLLKEELYAWINAFKYIWQINSILDLTIYYKILITFVMLFLSIEALAGYVRGVFVIKLK